MRVTALWVMLLALLVIAGPGFAELYQYKDQNGVTHYTDDLGNVPEKYRQDMETRPEIPNSSRIREVDIQGAGSQNAAKPDDAGQMAPDQNKNAKLSEKAKKLADQQAELLQEYEQIQSRRQELVDNPPPESASREQKRVYSQKVRELNERMESYKQKAKAFEKKVEAFNAEVGKQTE